MKRTTSVLMTMLFAATIVIVFSCKKQSDDSDTRAAEDNSLAEGTFNDVNNIANQAYTNGGAGLSTYKVIHDNASLLSGCANISITPDQIGNGATIGIDFGPSPCPCMDGRYRQGIILVHYTGSYRDSGSVNTIAFQDYYVGPTTGNMYRVTGTKTVTNRGRNSNNHIWYAVEVNGHLQNSSGQTMTWYSLRQREWIAGESTALWMDDEYYITGQASGTSFAGTSFTVNITRPLHIKIGCWWIKDGTFDLIPSGKPTRTFDFGNGNCDANATVTINGHSFNITLR